MTNTARFARRLSINPRGWFALVATLLASGCGAGGALAGPEPTGSLEVLMSGLPDGLQGRVVVSGPNVSETLVASKTYNDLVPGSYTIVAEDIDTDELSYSASAATQVVNVNAGVKASKKVDYKPGPANTGGYELDVDGLPIAASGSVLVTGPKGYRHFLTRSTITDGIAVGTYQIAAEAVVVQGVNYSPESASQTMEVTKRSIRTAKVRYRSSLTAPLTGTLSINTGGLPAGTAASVRVTGPNGFDQLVTNTTSISGAPAGDYTIAAQNVTIAGTNYIAAPASQVATVSGNTTTTRTVSYTAAAAITGTLTVKTSGLPAGAAASVRVTGPNGFSQAITSTTTISGAATGNYTLVAQSVVFAGVTYEPRDPSQIVAVAAGALSTENVAYLVAAPTVGSLSISMTGLAAGAASPITVTGPNGYSRSLTVAATIDSLAPGSYTIAATNVVTNGITSYATPASQVATITAGATTTKSVTYAVAPVTTGTLSIVTSGLPVGTAAAIAVSGPNGFTQAVTTTTQINGAPLGSYTVAAQNVTVAGVSYLASAASQVVAITAGVTSTVSVTYAVAPPTVGTLTVNVTGLGSGVPAAITITGPNSYSRTLTTNTTIDSLAPGSYTIAAANVTLGGVIQIATPASQSATITAGTTTSRTVAYTAAAPTVGTLTVSVTGLGGSVDAALTLTGPNSYSRTLTASTTIDSLAPGSYTLAASNVVAGGVTNVPSPSSQVAVVAAGATTSRSVAYAVAAPTVGELAVSITGLPAGTAASVLVTGPGSFSRTITSNTTIDSLAPGSYTIAANSVTANGVSQLPTPTSQTATVTAGTTVTRTVSYAAAAPTTGSLAVTVTGLPGGASSAITVTGPSGFNRIVTSSETITSLPIGTYTVAAGNVTSGGTSYTPSATSQSAVVVAGTTVTRTVAYTAVAAPATVTVDTTTKFQRMSGWEATSQVGQIEPGFTGWQNELLDLAANDLGINRMRLEIASGAENTVDYYAQFRAGQITSAQYNAQRYNWVNDNADPNSVNASGYKWSKLDESIEVSVLPMRQRLAARGEALYVNLNYVSFANSTAHANAAEYAELILATFQHMQSKYGFVPNALEVILEPDNNTGTWYAAAIGRAIAAVGPRLAAAGFHPDIIAPSVTNMANAVPYFDAIIAVPGALQYITDIAFHRYSGVSDATLSAIKSRAAQYGLRTAMLEHIGSGVEDLYRDLTIANVSAWQQYTLAYTGTDNGAHLYTIIGGRPIEGVLTKSLHQYFKNVRSGAWRVAASSTNGSVRPVAFTNPGTGMAVVLHIDAAGTYTVRGLRTGTYTVSMTTAGGTIISLPSVTATTGGTVTISPTQTGILSLGK